MFFSFDDDFFPCLPDMGLETMIISFNRNEVEI